MYDWRVGVIEDGLEQEAYIAEEMGLHPECRFSYRPMSPEEFESFDDKVSKESPGRSRAMVGKLLSDKIRKWSLVNSKGLPVAITEYSCRSLRAILQMKIYQIVTGVRATDIDPMHGAAEDKQDFKPLEELAGAGEKLGN
jgi:hypothetical protein